MDSFGLVLPFLKEVVVVGSVYSLDLMGSLSLLLAFQPSCP